MRRRPPTGFRCRVALPALVAMLFPLRAPCAEANHPETWSGSTKEGWRCLNHASGTYEDAALALDTGSLLLTYPAHASSGDPAEKYAFVANASSSGGRFEGSYYDVGAKELRFSFYADAVPELTVWLWNGANFIVYTATVPVVVGWQTAVLPLDTQHFAPDLGAPSDSDFDTLMRQVDEVWINVQRNASLAEQHFRVDNVELVGTGPGYAAWMDPFGAALTNRLPGADWDGDGSPNGDEYLADTLPNSAASLLTVRQGSNAWTVGWPASSNRVYALLRGTNLVSGGETTVHAGIGNGAVQWISDEPAAALPFVTYRVRAALP